MSFSITSGQLADFIHSQMQAHHWEKASGYDVVVSKGFTALKPLAFTAPADEADSRFPTTPRRRDEDCAVGLRRIHRCLYPVQKFQSDTERVMAIILDREVRRNGSSPAAGQFQIFYKWGSRPARISARLCRRDQDAIYMLEPKMRKDMEDPRSSRRKMPPSAGVSELRLTRARTAESSGTTFSFPTMRLLKI